MDVPIQVLLERLTSFIEHTEMLLSHLPHELDNLGGEHQSLVSVLSSVVQRATTSNLTGPDPEIGPRLDLVSLIPLNQIRILQQTLHVALPNQQTAKKRPEPSASRQSSHLKQV
jgi:hypothetical protein